MIGGAILLDGLYYFDESSTSDRKKNVHMALALC